jgi:hypothetical protein
LGDEAGVVADGLATDDAEVESPVLLGMVWPLSEKEKVRVAKLTAATIQAFDLIKFGD